MAIYQTKWQPNKPIKSAKAAPGTSRWRVNREAFQATRDPAYLEDGHAILHQARWDYFELDLQHQKDTANP